MKTLPIFLIVACSVSSTSQAEPLGFFFRSTPSSYSSAGVLLEEYGYSGPALDDVVLYRLVPGDFPNSIGYHFDGLASVLRFSFQDGVLSYSLKAFDSLASRRFRECIYYASGTGPTLGVFPCLLNPAVNLLPIAGQMWLTIDTSFWGRVDPDTLETLGDSIQVPSFVANAHPACDPDSGVCYIEHSCSRTLYSNEACISTLEPTDGDLLTREVSRVTMPGHKLIQHSHSPCLTEKHLIVKLDAFEPHLNSQSGTGGLLKFARQQEDNVWMVMERSTGRSRILTSDLAFVNNHFWNCFERDDGAVVVDTVAATHSYLDQYFLERASRDTTDWAALFKAPQRCIVPAEGTQIACSDLLREAAYFDYPTFDPRVKMRGTDIYTHFYAVSPASSTSRWFDTIIKIDTRTGEIVRRWGRPELFVTEANFVPLGGADSTDGILMSIVYDATTDQSALALLDADRLTLLAEIPLSFVVPFHAHGVACVDGQCFPNP